MKIVRGDIVQILLGKDRGKSGKVLRVLSKESKILVEGVNVYKRHVRKMGNRQGGIIDKSLPINISNVVLVCPHCQKPTRVGYKIAGKSKVRICKKCQEEIK